MKIARVIKSGKETFGLIKDNKIATKDEIAQSTGIPIPLNVRDFLFDGWYEEIRLVKPIAFRSALIA